MASKTNRQQQRDEALAKARALRAAQEARDQRNKRITLAIVGVAVLALIVGGVWLVLAERAGKDSVPNFDASIPLAQVQNVPHGATPDGGIHVDKTGAASPDMTPGVPTLGIIYDYICPFCGQLEEINLDSINEMVHNGEANFVLYPVNLMDRASGGTKYSTRAAAAAAWVADRDSANFLAFHEALFAHQPTEGGRGLTNAEIAAIAVGAGVPQTVADGITDGTAVDTFGQWVTSASAEAFANTALQNAQGSFGTPTVTINGQRSDVNWSTVGALADAVRAAGPAQ